MTILEKDNQYIWHPYTPLLTGIENIPIVRGEGALLFDNNDKSYIDAVSSWWVNLHGHAHPYIAEKIYEQAKKLEHVIFAGFTHEPAVQLVERLLKHLPSNQKKIFYSDDGSTAVEVAVKMAIQYWANCGEKKNTIIAFEDGYHGDTFGAMSVSARSIFTSPFNDFLFEVKFIPIPNEKNSNDIIKQVEHITKNNTVAAFIYEPLLQGTGGMKMYPADSLDKLLQFIKSKNIICIADEVLTGFYRTGKFFASDYVNEQPDVVCLSKGLTGGTMAFGVTSCSQKIIDAFLTPDKTKTFYHGHSYTANPLACAAALASLDLIEDNNTLKNIKRIEQQHKIFLEELKNNAAIENARQLGTIIAFEIKTKSEDSYLSPIRDVIYKNFIEHGILLRPLGNTIYILPPYCITEEQLNKVYKVIREELMKMR
jgi:adenosylmethionine---8-amino-7-oxononanoate aminotransferase